MYSKIVQHKGKRRDGGVCNYRDNIEQGEDILILKGCVTREKTEDFLANRRSTSWATIILDKLH